MFQLSIGSQKVGQPMSYEDASYWQWILSKWFPKEVIWMVDVSFSYLVAQYDVMPMYTVNEQPSLIFLKKEGVSQEEKLVDK